MIINRYLYKEISANFMGTLIVLTLVIVGNAFVRLLADASAGQLPADLLLESLFYVSTKNLIKLIPVALLIGMMLAFSRMYRDSEITAIQAAGISPYHLYRAAFTFVVPLTMVLAALVLYAGPWAESKYQNVRQQVDERPEAAGIPAGMFKTTTTTDGEVTLLAEDIEDNKSTMKRFFFHMKNADGETIIWGRSAQLFINSVSGERILEVHDGRRYEYPNTDNTTIIKFEEHGISMPLRENVSVSRIGSIPTEELFDNMDTDKHAELHWRIAVILSAPLMALLALPLSHTNPRQGRYSKVSIGILVYAVYANMLLSGKSLLQKDRIPDWIGLWWAHILLLLLVYWLLRHNFGKAK
jgi:lipopolysaccharide export system permease protein